MCKISTIFRIATLTLIVVSIKHKNMNLELAPNNANMLNQSFDGLVN
jgi:hypothetical protein